MAFKAGAIYGEAKLDTKKWNTGLKKLGKSTALAAAAIGAAFIAIMTKAVKAGNEFQIAMSNVASITDEATVSTQQLALEILRLNPNLGDATELAKGMYQAISAGAVTAEDAMQTTVDAAIFAKAALTDTFTAVDALTTAVNAYGRETMTTTKAADIFFTTVKLGKITGDELASSIGMAIPVYAAAGISLEELASGVAAMTKQGLNAHVAMTQLRQIVMTFLNPNEALTKSIEELGYESGAAFMKVEGLEGILKLIEDTTKGDAAEMRKLIPNVRALTGAMALTGVGGETFNETLEAMAEASGSAAEAFERQEKTFKTFGAASKNVMILIGNIGKHFVDKIAVGATTAANSVIQFLMSSQGMNLVADIVAYLTAGWEALTIVAQSVIDVLRPALEEIWAATSELLAELTGKTTDTAGAMNILAIIVNVASSAINIFGGQIVAGINILRDWITAISASASTVGTFFQMLIGKAKWKDVKEQANLAGTAFKNLGASFKTLYVGMFESIREEVIGFSEATKILTTKLEINVSAAFDRTNTNIKSNWNEIITGMGDFLDVLGEGVLGIPEVIGEANDEGTVDTEKATRIIRSLWMDLWSKTIESGNVSFKTLNEILRRSYAQGIIDQEAYETISLNLWKKHWGEKVDEVQEKFDRITGAIKYGTDAMFAISDQYRANEKAENEIWYQDELAALEKKLEDGLIEEEAFNEAKNELDEKALKKENALRKEAFVADKRNRLVEVAMNAASAVMGWWVQASKIGPIAGPIFAGIMTGLTAVTSAAQIALISAQKFVPSRQEGGLTGGLTRVNEQGGEIITLPDNSQVIPADISRQIGLAAGAGTIINVSFEGANISDELELDEVVETVITRLGKEMRLVG